MEGRKTSLISCKAPSITSKLNPSPGTAVQPHGDAGTAAMVQPNASTGASTNSRLVVVIVQESSWCRRRLVGADGLAEEMDASFRGGSGSCHRSRRRRRGYDEPRRGRGALRRRRLLGTTAGGGG